MPDTFDLKAETEALLRRLGALEPDRRDEPLYRFLILNTRAGPLAVQPHDSFIACRFEYPKIAACRVSGPLNPHTGKWNWHTDPGAPAREMLQAFERALRDELRVADLNEAPTPRVNRVIDDGLAVVGGCALRLGFCRREDCERPCLRRDPRLASNVPDVDTPADWRACDLFIPTGTEGVPC